MQSNPSPEIIEKRKAAILLERQNRLYEAADLYREIVQKEPESVKDWKHLSFVLARLGKPDEFRQVNETILTFEPDDSRTLHELARIHHKNGDDSKSEELYKKAITNNHFGPETCSMCLDLSRMYFQQKRWDDAKMILLTATLADPSSFGAYYNLAYLYWSLKRWDDALSICMQALEIRPNDVLTHQLLRWILYEMGEQKIGNKIQTKIVALRAKEEEIKCQWEQLIDEARRDLKVSPYRFELFLPDEGLQ